MAASDRWPGFLLTTERTVSSASAHPAFVSDCLETSIEISERNKKVFIQHGGEEFKLVPSLNDNDSWVDAIIDIINFRG